ncbi:DsbA family oxidoreductase [Marinobacter sp.]|uniref:DsbA family oxidoreductase n=1 Tax=Marinobacter sp. TaxID=50741 RepID=UPI00384C39AE
MKTLQIDIVSDIACPWCAIGFARLEQAMQELAGELSFRIEWHAFELNPDESAQGRPILEALAEKYGSTQAEMEKAQAGMQEAARDLGLDFTRMQERRTCNTFDAHRLLKWAGEQSRETDLMKAFFEAYFGHAENISDHEVLVRYVESAGLDGTRAKEVLDSDDYADAVRKDEARYQQAGISSVPAFIIDQQYLISGAQEPEYLVQALRQIASGEVETQQG